MSGTNAIWRWLALIVGTALALRLAWQLIQPALPAIAVVLAAVAIVQVVSWWRGRW